MALVHLNFESQFLNGNHEVSIILPDKPRGLTPSAFYGSERRYKVLWLLHGTYGDHSDWIRKSNIELYACEKDLIVVMPSALNSDYVDWPGFACGYDMWSYLTDELMPLVYGWLPASAAREDNYIAGLSMGGMGTIQYATAHPEKFAAAAVLSWAPLNLRNMDTREEASLPPRQQNMIRNAGGFERYLESCQNVWDRLSEFCGDHAGNLPRLYFAIGKNDFLFENYTAFKKYALEIGLAATFEEFDGYTHEWRFWDLTIQRALDFFGLGGKDAGNPF